MGTELQLRQKARGVAEFSLSNVTWARLGPVTLDRNSTWSSWTDCLFQKNANFLTVDLREVFTSGDMLHSISISKKLYFTNLIRFTYHTWFALKVQYCIGRAFLLLSPIWYKLWTFLWLIWEKTLLKGTSSIQLVYQKRYSTQSWKNQPITHKWACKYRTA